MALRVTWKSQETSRSLRSTEPACRWIRRKTSWRMSSASASLATRRAMKARRRSPNSDQICWVSQCCAWLIMARLTALPHAQERSLLATAAPGGGLAAARGLLRRLAARDLLDRGAAARRLRHGLRRVDADV